MAATVVQLQGARGPLLTEQDLEKMAAIQQKRLAGKALTADDRAVMGRVADMVVDTIEIPENEALRSILRRFMTNGEISAKEQGQLREALGDIPDIKENPQLTAHLKALRAKGFATDAEIDQIPKLAGKLSVHEDDAIYATLASLAIARGISEPAAEKIQQFIERGRIDREKFTNKQGAAASAKRIGLVALAVLGITALFAVAPVAALGSAGAFAAQLGLTVGAVFGVNQVQGALSRSNSEKVMSYGVHD